MQITVDARGLSCPIPQIRTLDAIRSTREGEIVILVDEVSACDSVIRTAKALGLAYKLERRNDDFKLIINKGELWITKKLMPEG